MSDISVYEMPARTIYIMPRTLVINGNQYIDYRLEGYEYAVMQTEENDGTTCNP